MGAYYNEIDPYAAQWLRNLIVAGHIAPGDVDERSIVDVRSDDLREYTQCHFFAGIGVWSYALRLAGWTDDRPVWTGSCPCQPFSAAGKRAGQADARHLWPEWLRLIGESDPSTIFGEQVDDAIGADWLDDVFVSLEALGYACGAADFPACSVGAPHIRQRVYFVADADGRNASAEREQRSREQRLLAPGCGTDVLADSGSERRQQVGRGAPCDEASNGRAGRHELESNSDHVVASDGENNARELADAERTERRAHVERRADGQHEIEVGSQSSSRLGECSEPRELEYAGCEQPIRSTGAGRQAERGIEYASVVGDAECARHEGHKRSGNVELHRGAESLRSTAAPSAVNGFWRDAIWLPCRDGKARAIKSCIEPLVNGTPARVGRLRAYGNCIVAPQAAEFIRAYLE